MNLYPKDLNVKHEDVEQRGLGSMTQTTREGKLIDFIARARKKEGSERTISRTLRYLTETSSIDDLHNRVSDEGSLSTTSEAVVGEAYAGKESVGIVDLCRYAMGIYDFQLTKDKLGKLGCTCEKVEAVHRYLRTL